MEGYANGDRQRIMTLDDVEFLRRFLLHVLPKGFMRIRYYGFLAKRHRTDKLERIRLLLSQQPLSSSEPRVCSPGEREDDHVVDSNEPPCVRVVVACPTRRGEL